VIDLHAHILPGLDDGPEDWGESLAMCRIAEQDGIRTLVATSHMFNGLYHVARQEILTGIAQLKERLAGKGIALEILPGAEIHATTELPSLLKQGEALTLNNGGRYILLELPADVIPDGLDKVLFSIRTQGIVAIVAHPERNLEIQSNPKRLQRIVDAGHLAQLTGFSVTGHFGEEAYESAWHLLKSGLCHFVASDCHSLAGRPPVLSEAREAVQSALGAKKAQALFDENPQRVLSGEAIEALPEDWDAMQRGKRGWFRRLWTPRRESP
jgi:protein-tyrosine phosphatase